MARSSYKVDLDLVQHVWVANVEATAPEPRVLLCNEPNINLDTALEIIRNTISRHALNPWSEGKPPRSGGARGTPPVGFGRHQ